jgi:hypothetical protein
VLPRIPLSDWDLEDRRRHQIALRMPNSRIALELLSERDIARFSAGLAEIAARGRMQAIARRVAIPEVYRRREVSRRDWQPDWARRLSMRPDSSTGGALRIIATQEVITEGPSRRGAQNSAHETHREIRLPFFYHVAPPAVTA